MGREDLVMNRCQEVETTNLSTQANTSIERPVFWHKYFPTSTNSSGSLYIDRIQ
uniref:Uncharacterized protein n=1 Tax=Anguilla anguilla TaxID=7936 RepID=A0A0E9P517_ANGAN